MDCCCCPFLLTLQVYAPSASRLSAIAMSGPGDAFHAPTMSAGGGGGGAASVVWVAGAVPAAGAAAGACPPTVAGAFGTVADVATRGAPPVVVGWPPPATAVGAAVAASLTLVSALANEAES